MNSQPDEVGELADGGRQDLKAVGVEGEPGQRCALSQLSRSQLQVVGVQAQVVQLGEAPAQREGHGVEFGVEFIKNVTECGLSRSSLERRLHGGRGLRCRVDSSHFHINFSGSAS